MVYILYCYIYTYTHKHVCMPFCLTVLDAPRSAACGLWVSGSALSAFLEFFYWPDISAWDLGQGTADKLSLFSMLQMRRCRLGINNEKCIELRLGEAVTWKHTLASDQGRHAPRAVARERGPLNLLNAAGSRSFDCAVQDDCQTFHTGPVMRKDLGEGSA